MKKVKESKAVFDHIKIPEELDRTVKAAIKEHTEQNGSAVKNRGGRLMNKALKFTAAAAAALVLLFFTALNTSQAFAQSAGGIPVIGKLADILTVRSYTKAEDNADISVKVPEVVVNDETKNDGQFIADINSEIQKIVNQYTADAEARQKADKEAFLATGGTEDEWAEKDLDINVDYVVKYQQGNLLSFVLTADESWYGAYDLRYYYNLDLEESRELTLKDLLGENYKDITNESIKQQMKDRTAQNPDYVYWGVAGEKEPSGIPGFTSVDENTKFYINEEGKPVVCFAQYEVAPGFMGDQEFVIE